MAEGTQRGSCSAAKFFAGTAGLCIAHYVMGFLAIVIRWRVKRFVALRDMV